MSAQRTMLLIDADNVSVDVMEQAVEQLLAEHGALHVRRAYCNAESALKHQAVFKRLGIRPMVNLSAGKNSTDIALAVDALDLVLSERPALVAIASSDSDFAPLVGRLREKGCRVVGIGQSGKTGDATQAVYDAFTVLSHRKAPAPAPRPAAKAPAKSAARSTAKPAAKPAAKAPAKTAAAKTPRKTPRRRAAAKPAGAASAASAIPALLAGDAPPLADKLQQILAAMPELERGETVELRVAAERLRAAGLMSKNGTSPKIFGAYPARFELLPARQPNKVRLLD